MHLPKDGEIGIIVNYRSITLTSIVARFLICKLPKCIRIEFLKITKKNYYRFWRYRSATSEIQSFRRSIEGVRSKNFEAIGFSKTFNSLNTGKMEQIPLHLVSPKNCYRYNDALQKHMQWLAYLMRRQTLSTLSLEF